MGPNLQLLPLLISREQEKKSDSRPMIGLVSFRPWFTFFLVRGEGLTVGQEGSLSTKVIRDNLTSLSKQLSKVLLTEKVLEPLQGVREACYARAGIIRGRETLSDGGRADKPILTIPAAALLRTAW